MSVSLREPESFEARAEPRARHSRWLPRGDLAARAAIALAVGVRAAHALSADFPLNDGGLLHQMTEDVQRAGFRLPAFTTYNDAGVPFAYPPAALYLTAAINAATGIPLVELVRFLPLLFTVLIVVAFSRLANAMLPSRAAAVGAVLAFAVLPRSFTWLLMGGGLTRSLGMLAAVVALHQAYLLFTRREWRYAITTSLASALTVLSHLGTATFLALSVALLLVFHGRHRRGVASALVVLAATMFLTAPWWGTVVAQHGIAPFAAVHASTPSVFTDATTRYEALMRVAQLNLRTTGEPLFPVVGFLAVLGCATAFLRGRLVLVLWWVALVLLDARHGPTYASIPCALLAGIGIGEVLLPGLRALYGRLEPSRRVRELRPPPARHLSGAAPIAILSGLALFGVYSALSRNPDFRVGEASALVALSPDDRREMQWVAANTPAASRFLVVTGRPWQLDRVSEWFPVLTKRVSVSTVQGLQWRPHFVERSESNDFFQSSCRNAPSYCLSLLADPAQMPFTHLYVWKSPISPCCATLIQALRTHPRFVVLEDGPAALIARRR